MRDDEKLVPIAEFDGEFDAELAKNALADAGIESVIYGEDLMPVLPNIEAFRVELRVFEADAERAKQILAEKQPLRSEDDVEYDDKEVDE
jgi:hypothetical protein